MVEKLTEITLLRGATCAVEFDLSDFDFQGGFVRFTMRDKKDNLIREDDMNTVGVNTINFNDEFTAILNDDSYSYDLMWHLASERFAQCLPTNIKVLDTVGGAQYE